MNLSLRHFFVHLLLALLLTAPLAVSNAQNPEGEQGDPSPPHEIDPQSRMLLHLLEMSPEELASLRTTIERIEQMTPEAKERLSERVRKFSAMDQTMRKNLRERIGNIPPEKRKEMRARWRDLDTEEKRDRLERLKSLSPEERIAKFEEWKVIPPPNAQSRSRKESQADPKDRAKTKDPRKPERAPATTSE